MSTPKAPAPADPKETASAQTSSNVMTAIANQRLNNMNQITPEGTLRYEQTDTYQITDPLNNVTYDLPLMTAIQELSPDQEAIQAQNRRSDLNLATFAADQSEKANELLSNPFDVSGLQAGGNPESIGNVNLAKVGNNMPQLNGTIDNAGQIQRNLADPGGITRSYGTDFTADRQRVEDALMQRMNPLLDRRRDQLEASLANKGIQMGSEAYQNAMDDLNRGENDARFGAILNAGQEQTRLANLEAQRAGFENAAQMQAYNQSMGAGTFANQAQNQQFNQNLQRNLFANQTAQQGFDNNIRATTTDNQTAVTKQNAEIAKFNALNAARNQSLNEAFAVRNQPINEITALLSGTNVQNPNFINRNVSAIANTDYAGIQANYDQQMFNRAQADNAYSNSLTGGLFSGASNIGAAYLGAPR
ncbi:MAG: tail fiber domain-containing protein [Pseudomonadota bacterium]